MKHFKFVLFLLVALALVLAACGSPATEPVLPVEPAESGEPAAPAATEAPAVDPNAPVKGGTVIVGTPQEPGTLNLEFSGSQPRGSPPGFISVQLFWGANPSFKNLVVASLKELC